jgi:F-type H+-transporting ATPase subunit delta
MFTPKRWAAAFLAALDGGEPGGGPGDGTAEEGLAVLRILAGVFGGIPFALAGYSASRRLGAMTRAALDAAGGYGRGAEFAAGLALLLVRKNAFAHVSRVIREIEGMIDERRGVLNAVLESALPEDGDGDGELKESLEKILCSKTGAAEVRLECRLVPELMGGFRLRVGCDYTDASLRGLLQDMAADMAGGSL